MAVEDGTGLANADAYQSIDDIETYATDHGLDWAPLTDEAGEAQARNAALYLDGHYRARLPGSRVNGRSQSLEWPRKNAVDTSGEDINDESVPPEWLAANSEVAIYLLANPGALTPVVTPGTKKKMVEISGAVTVEYAISDNDVVGDFTPVMTRVDELLSGILTGLQTGRSVVKFLRRA